MNHKTLYIPQGTNLNLEYNRTFEKISKNKTELIILFIDVENFNPNGNVNTYLPYSQSLNSYIKELKEKGIKVEYLKIKSIDDKEKENYLLNLLKQYNFNEVYIDKPLIEKTSLKINAIFEKLNINPFYIGHSYEEFSFGTAKSGANQLLNYSKDKMPKINWNNINNLSGFKYNEYSINKDKILSRKKIYEQIENQIKNNYRNNRDETWGSMRISPYINTGYLSIYELIDKFRLYGKSDSGFHLFRELAFLIMAIQKIEKLFWNKNLEFKNISKSLLSENSIINFEKHSKDIKNGNIKFYNYEQLENGNTYSELYNKTVEIVKKTGFLHNRIRMWWISWLIGNSKSFEDAYNFAIYFQEKYCSDARHPVTYFCTIDAFKITPKRDELIYGRILRMVEEKAKEKIGKDYETLYLDCIENKKNFFDIYNYKK